MKEKVITLLNKARSAELGSIAQYMIHHYELEDQDFGKLAAGVKEVAIVEMKHAEKLAERILFLGGVPTSKPDLDPQKRPIHPGDFGHRRIPGEESRGDVQRSRGSLRRSTGSKIQGSLRGSGRRRRGTLEPF